MIEITRTEYFVIFLNGEIMFEWNAGLDRWGISQRLVKRDPDGRDVELLFSDVLSKADVREIEAIPFLDGHLYVCVVGSHTTGKKLESANFWGRKNLPSLDRLTKETQIALSIPAVQDRFL